MYDPLESVEQARQRYFRENSLPPDGGETARWVRIQFGPVPFFFPNSRSRVRSLIRHDLHHIANDCDTSLIGEGIIAAWELGKGCGDHPVAWFLQLQALWLGILFAPRRTFQAFIHGRRSHNLYHEEDVHRWLGQPVKQLRDHLFPERFSPSATSADAVKFLFFALIGLALFFLALPFYLFPITLPALIWFLAG